jgi:hypothetical protein
MVDELHTLIWNKTKKFLLTGAGRVSRERDGGGNLTNV